jgi:YbbR domain-containing protein
MLRWLTINLRTFLLAFALAVAVWVTAVSSADPDETQILPSSIPIQYVGQDSSLALKGTVPEQVQVTLRAPHSIWEKLTSGEAPVYAVVDLTGLGSGTHSVEVQIQIPIRPVRIVSVIPQNIDFTLEPLVTKTFPVEISFTGEPAIGYKAGDAVLDPASVVVSGPASVMALVKQLRAVLDVNGARQSIDTSLPITASDNDNMPLSGVAIHPDMVNINLPLIQQVGYRDLAVKVVTIGRLTSGYNLKNIASSPLIVTVYSDDLDLIDSLPGYVETAPLDLSGASGNIDANLSLNLPSGVVLIGDQTVSVQIEIIPIEGSRPVSYRPVEVVGLAAGLTAQLSPTTVEVLLSGPLPALNSLLVSDVHVRMDLTGLSAGTYQLTPTVSIANTEVTVQSILPGTVEVILTNVATPTP